jgi:hypothetical protein
VAQLVPAAAAVVVDSTAAVEAAVPTAADAANVSSS